MSLADEGACALRLKSLPTFLADSFWPFLYSDARRQPELALRFGVTMGVAAGGFERGRSMPADERNRTGAPSAQARDSSAVLEPLRPLRSPLRGVDGSVSVGSLGEEVDRLQSELSTVRKSLRTQRAETRVEKQNNALLRAEIEALRRKVGSSAEDNVPADSAASGSSDAHQMELARLRREYDQRERELEMRCAHEIALLEEKQAAKVSALRDSLRVAEELSLAKTERIRRLEDRLLRLQSEGVLTVGNSDKRRLSVRDDLTTLRGVGPAYVHALRREGVVSFSQIAAWTFDDVRNIAPKIGTTQGRIFRDDWVGQAKKLVRDCAAVAKIR